MAYIDADKLINEVSSLEQLARKRVYDTPTNSPAYERYSTQYQERERILSIIKAQPTADVVEVVRCRDCKYYKIGNPNADYCDHERHEHHAQGTSYAPDDFCSYGERKE